MTFKNVNKKRTNSTSKSLPLRYTLFVAMSIFTSKTFLTQKLIFGATAQNIEKCPF